MDNIFIKKDELNKWIIKHLPNKDLISIDDLINAIENLDGELEDWKLKYEELERDLEDNYKPISKAEQYEIIDDEII